MGPVRGHARCQLMPVSRITRLSSHNQQTDPCTTVIHSWMGIWQSGRIPHNSYFHLVAGFDLHGLLPSSTIGLVSFSNNSLLWLQFMGATLRLVGWTFQSVANVHNLLTVDDSEAIHFVRVAKSTIPAKYSMNNFMENYSILLQSISFCPHYIG